MEFQQKIIQLEDLQRSRYYPFPQSFSPPYSPASMHSQSPNIEYSPQQSTNQFLSANDKKHLKRTDEFTTQCRFCKLYYNGVHGLKIHMSHRHKDQLIH